MTAIVRNRSLTSAAILGSTGNATHVPGVYVAPGAESPYSARLTENIAPGADESGTARNLAALLARSEPRKSQESPAKSDLLTALLALSPEDRRAILRTLGEKL